MALITTNIPPTFVQVVFPVMLAADKVNNPISKVTNNTTNKTVALNTNKVNITETPPPTNQPIKKNPIALLNMAGSS